MVRLKIRFSVLLVSGCTRVLILLSVVIVPYPCLSGKDGSSSKPSLPPKASADSIQRVSKFVATHKPKVSGKYYVFTSFQKSCFNNYNNETTVYKAQ